MMATRLDDHDRILPPECGFNIRDFGGYPTASGAHVRQGKLYRAGMMARVEEAGRERLAALGIVAICDLRSSGERGQRPTRWHEGLEVEYWARDYGETDANLAEAIRDGQTDAASMRERMIALYRDIAFEHASSYRTLFEMLTDNKVPLIVNCSAGKDRTGAAVALVLSALGVPRQTILADYVLTERADFDDLVQQMGSREFSALSPDAFAPLLAADPVYLETLFDAVEARCGSVERYLEAELDLDETQRGQIMTNLLDG